MNKGQALNRTTVCECGYSYTGHPNQMKTARRLHAKVCHVQIQYRKDGYEITPHVEPPLSYKSKINKGKGDTYLIPPNINKIESIAPVYLTHHTTNDIVKNSKDIDMQFIFEELKDGP